MTANVIILPYRGGGGAGFPCHHVCLNIIVACCVFHIQDSPFALLAYCVSTYKSSYFLGHSSVLAQAHGTHKATEPKPRQNSRPHGQPCSNSNNHSLQTVTGINRIQGLALFSWSHAKDKLDPHTAFSIQSEPTFKLNAVHTNSYPNMYTSLSGTHRNHYVSTSLIRANLIRKHRRHHPPFPDLSCTHH